MNDPSDDDVVVEEELVRARVCVEKFVEAHSDKHPTWALAAGLGSEAAVLVLELAYDTGKNYEECKRVYLTSLSDVFDLLIAALAVSPIEPVKAVHQIKIKKNESLH